MANPQASALSFTVDTMDVTGTGPYVTNSGANAVIAAIVAQGNYTLANGVYTLTPTDTPLYVAAFVDGSQRARSFVPPVGTQSSQYNGATVGVGGTGLVAGSLYGSSTPVAVVMPSLYSAQVLLDSNGGATGPLKLTLVPGTGDITNASSVMTYLLDQDVMLTTVTGTF